jgi:N-dimethylarginine dimethylaminohydrolase
MATTKAPLLTQHLSIRDLKEMPLPRAVLMCAPDYFNVVDVKNPFMEGQQGKVDIPLARKQWQNVVDAFEGIGIRVQLIPPVADCEDMVFCANPIFAGLDAEDRRVSVLSQMRYGSREREVPAHAAWFKGHGYRVIPIEEPGCLFEGSGDALWHPGRRLIWGGYGHRTSKQIYRKLSEIFEAPVMLLELPTELFYHLDTCFGLMDENTAVVYPGALTNAGMDLIRSLIPCVIEVDEEEATKAMACNGAAFLGKHVVLQSGAPRVCGKLRERGFHVIEVETSEFMKSGGSVFCMKMYLF